MEAAQSQVHNVAFHPKVDFLFQPHRYKVLHGGRYGINSWSIARALLIQAIKEPKRWLCCRELQNSTQESVHHLLQDQIGMRGFDSAFDVRQTTILDVCIGKSKTHFGEGGTLRP